MTVYHAKYFAHDLTRRAVNGIDRLSMSLFDAAVDLNPHQIEAALFALQSPLSKGVILADEVGLGKTIEAVIVLCQFWAERKRKLLVLCPASLRKQWALELGDKFNLPTRVLDAKAFRDEQRNGRMPLTEKAKEIKNPKWAAVGATSIRFRATMPTCGHRESKANSRRRSRKAVILGMAMGFRYLSSAFGAQLASARGVQLLRPAGRTSEFQLFCHHSSLQSTSASSQAQLRSRRGKP